MFNLVKRKTHHNVKHPQHVQKTTKHVHINNNDDEIDDKHIHNHTDNNQNNYTKEIVPVSQNDKLIIFSKNGNPSFSAHLAYDYENDKFIAENIYVSNSATIKGIINVTGLQLIPQNSNPGNEHTLWINADNNSFIGSTLHGINISKNITGTQQIQSYGSVGPKGDKGDTDPQGSQGMLSYKQDILLITTSNNGGIKEARTLVSPLLNYDIKAINGESNSNSNKINIAINKIEQGKYNLQIFNKTIETISFYIISHITANNSDISVISYNETATPDNHNEYIFCIHEKNGNQIDQDSKITLAITNGTFNIMTLS